MHPIALLSRLPYHNDTAEWAQLTPDERTTLDNARDVVALGRRLHADEYHTLLTAYRRITDASTSKQGGEDEVIE